MLTDRTRILLHGDYVIESDCNNLALEIKTKDFLDILETVDAELLAEALARTGEYKIKQRPDEPFDMRGL